MAIFIKKVFAHKIPTEKIIIKSKKQGNKDTDKKISPNKAKTHVYKDDDQKIDIKKSKTHDNKDSDQKIDIKKSKKQSY